MPDSPAGDEEEGYTPDQAEEALKAMGIKVKSRSERKKAKGKGKGRKRSLENDDSDDFARFTERVQRQGNRLANAVEQVQEMQRESCNDVFDGLDYCRCPNVKTGPNRNVCSSMS